LKVLFHVTFPERVPSILKYGLNEYLNPERYERGIDIERKKNRIYLTKKQSLNKWVRILSREKGRDRVAILKVLIPESSYRKLRVRRFEDWKEPFISDWGDQVIIQIIGSLKEQFGIKIEPDKEIDLHART